MQNVKLIKFIDTDYHSDLTIGNVYDVESTYVYPEGSVYTGLVARIRDDAGDQNELYEGEYEVIE